MFPIEICPFEVPQYTLVNPAKLLKKVPYGVLIVNSFLASLGRTPKYLIFIEPIILACYLAAARLTELANIFNL